MDFMSAFTLTNIDPSFIFSLGPIERFLDNMSGFPLDMLHWAIWGLLGLTLLYNIYSMGLRAVTRWSDFWTKLKINKKTRTDTNYGNEIAEVIRKAFNEPGYKRLQDDGNGFMSSDGHELNRFNLYVEILRSAQQHLDLDAMYVILKSNPHNSKKDENDHLRGKKLKELVDNFTAELSERTITPNSPSE